MFLNWNFYIFSFKIKKDLILVAYLDGINALTTTLSKWVSVFNSVLDQ